MAGELDAGLIAEYEAIFTYGDAGPHLSDVQAETARTAEERHRDMRDAVLTWLHHAEHEPPAMQPVYELPIDPVDADSAAEAIHQAEQRCVRAWRSVLAATDGESRDLAVRAMSESAVSLGRWRRVLGQTPSVDAFPGRSA